MSLGSRVRHYRTKLSWTLEVLAEKSGVEVGTISALEKRASQRSQFTDKLAHAFDLTVEQLLDESRDWLDVTTRPKRGTKLHVVREERAPYGRWPMPGITPAEYFEVLSASDRSEILGFAKGLLKVRQAKAPAA